MHEEILISFKRNGESVPVTESDLDRRSGGIIPGGETSALP